jgi:hypothetical protein
MKKIGKKDMMPLIPCTGILERKGWQTIWPHISQLTKQDIQLLEAQTAELQEAEKIDWSQAPELKKSRRNKLKELSRSLSQRETVPFQKRQ